MVTHHWAHLGSVSWNYSHWGCHQWLQDVLLILRDEVMVLLGCSVLTALTEGPFSSQGVLGCCLAPWNDISELEFGSSCWFWISFLPQKSELQTLNGRHDLFAAPVSGFYQGCFRGLCFVPEVEQPSEILVKTQGLRNRLKELVMGCNQQECDCLPQLCPKPVSTKNVPWNHA